MFKKSAEKDLTVGSPAKLVIAFMFPQFLGLVFQQLYSMIDTIIVGKYLGVDALAGVGSTGSINFMVLGFCIGLCAGFSIPIAQEFGRKDFNKLKQFVGNIIWITILCAAVITTVISLLCKDILMWMKTPTDVFDYAYSYIFVIFLGIPVTFLYNILASIIRALGDSKSPLIFLIISSVLNIALDLCFIISLGMGTTGAALATVIAQFISGILCFVYMIFRFPILHLTKDEIKPRLKIILRLCSMGFPMGLQYTITAIGNIIVQVAVNGLGANCVAAMVAGNRSNQLSFCMYEALGATMSTFGGQNLGAGKISRIRKGLKTALLICLAYSVFMFILLYFFGRDFTMLFLSDEDPARQAEILELAQQFIMINASFYFSVGYILIVRFLIQGVGFPALAVLTGVFETVSRAVVAIALVPDFGFSAICIASPAAWILGDIFLFFAYIFCMKKLEKDVRRAQAERALAEQ